MKGNNCCLTDYITKINIGTHSDIYELVWFKLRMMIDTTEHCVLTAVHVTLILIQGHREAGKETFSAKYVSKVLVGFGWNLACY